MLMYMYIMLMFLYDIQECDDTANMLLIMLYDYRSFETNNCYFVILFAMRIMMSIYICSCILMFEGTWLLLASVHLKSFQK